MRKFQFFLIVESVLLLLALVTILADDVPRFIVILIMTLMAIKFYNHTDKVNFILTASLLIFFLIIMLNPYVILALIIGLIYMMINHFSQVQKNNRLAELSFETRPVTLTKHRNQWFGQEDLMADSYYFDDVDVIRITGNDTIDLSKVILRNQDNVILIRKVYGPTKLIVPFDVSVNLTVSSIYGAVTFFDEPSYDLRNESIKLRSDDYETSSRRVKIVVSNLAGNTEVTSR